MTMQARLFQAHDGGVVCKMACMACDILKLEELYKAELHAGHDLALMYHGGMCEKLAVVMVVQKAEGERMASIFVERFLG